MAFPILEQTPETMISSLYLAYFGRAADVDGLNFWTEQYQNAVDAGADPEAVLNGISESFRVSPEATDQFPILSSLQSGTGATVDTFLNNVYQNLFNRNMNIEELEEVSSEVQDRMEAGINIGDIIVDIIEDATDGTLIDRNFEGRVIQVETQDVSTLANKLSVATTYAEAFEAQGAEWTAEDDLEGAQMVVDNVTEADESLATYSEQAETLAADDAAEQTQAIGVAGSLDGIDIA